MALPHSGSEPPAGTESHGAATAGMSGAAHADASPAGPYPSNDAFLASLLGHLREAIFAVDAREHVTYWSGGAAALLGWSAAEALGRALRDLVDLRPFGAPLSPFAGLLRADTFHGEWMALDRGGRLISLDVRTTSLGKPGDDRDGFVAVLRDSTDHRRALADLREAVRLRDEVLGVVAHDLRSPLNLIVLEAELLRSRRSEPEERRTSVEAIFVAARRMDRLIEDLLDLELLRSGALPLPCDASPPRPILQEAVDALLPLARLSEITLDLETIGDLPEVTANRFRLLQILDNLLTNAIKYTPAGGRVSISAIAGRAEVEFRVSDTGCGIEAESLPRIFERFFRSSNRPRGAGLGLAIVKSLVEAYGGRVTVESTVGVGSTFHFTLPTAVIR